MPGQYGQPTPTSLGESFTGRIKGVQVCLFSRDLVPPALLAERPVSFMCQCGNTGGGMDN